MSYGAAQYKRTSIETASKPQILIMLYEAAIRHLKRAINAIEKNDLATKGEAIGKAHDIVNELINSLNFEVGGDIARDLEALYNYVIRELLDGNTKNDKKALENAKNTLATLLEGWRGAVKKLSED